jgi:hypothetical protein
VLFPTTTIPCTTIFPGRATARVVITSHGDGNYSFWGLPPTRTLITHDGPVGKMLEATGVPLPRVAPELHGHRREPRYPRHPHLRHGDPQIEIGDSVFGAKGS